MSTALDGWYWRAWNSRSISQVSEGIAAGVAAAVVVVGDGREEEGLQPLPHLGHRRAHRSLHLVVDDALVDQLGLGVAGSGPRSIR